MVCIDGGWCLLCSFLLVLASLLCCLCARAQVTNCFQSSSLPVTSIRHSVAAICLAQFTFVYLITTKYLQHGCYSVLLIDLRSDPVTSRSRYLPVALWICIVGCRVQTPRHNTDNRASSNTISNVYFSLCETKTQVTVLRSSVNIDTYYIIFRVDRSMF